MEGYVYYVADKLYTMRYGKERSVDICNFDIWTWRCWSSALREYFATTLFACVATLSTIPIGGSTPSDIRVAFAFGFAIYSTLLMFRSVEINPVVTISFVLIGEITPTRAVIFLLSQFSGHISGIFILKGITPATYHSELGVNKIHPELTLGQGVAMELIMTFVLLFTVMTELDRDKPNGGNVPFTAGLTLVGLVLSGVRYTTCALNPARTLASAIASNNYENIWVYFVGPFTGGILATFCYKYVFSPYTHVKPKISPRDAARKSLREDGLIAIPRDYFN